MEELVAVGYTIKGERIEFECKKGEIYCPNRDLTSLHIPKDARKIWCFNILW